MSKKEGVAGQRLKVTGGANQDRRADVTHRSKEYKYM